MKLGCIGYGNMATAILGGLLREELLPPKEVVVFDLAAERLEAATEIGLQTANTISDVIINADTIILAVKPKNFTEVLAEVKTVLDGKKLFISIAAGISIDIIGAALGRDVPVVRTMPNTPLLLGQGTTAICRNAAVDDADFAFAKQVFACAGTVYELPETQLDHVINLNGSSPAYIYLFAKTIAEFAEKEGGIPYDTGLSMISDTLIGSAKMLKNSGKTPDELIRAVSSPGGATLAALDAFDANGFVPALQAGLKASVARAEEMERENSK